MTGKSRCRSGRVAVVGRRYSGQANGRSEDICLMALAGGRCSAKNHAPLVAEWGEAWPADLCEIPRCVNSIKVSGEPGDDAAGPLRPCRPIV